MDEVKEKSALLKAKFAVTGRITQLGTKIILSVSLIDARNKVAIFTDKLTSSTVEDLEIVIKRLSDAVCTMEKAKTKVTVETITKEEAKPKLRRQSYHTWTLLLGYLIPMGASYGKEVENGYYVEELGGDVSSMPGYGFAWLYETTYHMAEVVVRVHGRKGSSHFSVAFCGYKFLSIEDFAPYIGGGLGMGGGGKVTGIELEDSWVDSQGDTHRVYRAKERGFDGLMAEIGGGFMLFRTYDFHFILNLKYNIIFADEIISGFILNLGISYKGESGICGL
jgi:hypothetical protein